MQTQEWVDITALVNEATEQMAPDQMIRMETLSLWDCMAALEIMEPRMDSGMRVPKSNVDKKWTVKKAKSIPQFTADEILGVCDGLLIKLISWLAGSHLSQTLFSCVLVHEPHACQSKLLKALIIAKLKIASRIKGIIEHVRVVEDDEFFGFLPYGFSLAEEVADSEAVDTLQTIEGNLMVDLKAIKQKLEGSEGLVPEDLSEDTEKLIFPETCTADVQRIQYLEAVIHRIQFYRALLASLNYTSKRNLGNAKRTLTTCLTLIDLCKLRIPLVKDMKVAFDTEVNRKLMHDSPPRAVAEPESIEAAYNEIQKILTQLLEIVSLPAGGLTLDDSLSFISYFCRAPTSAPLHSLVRSVLVLHFTHGQKLHGRTPYPTALIQTITNAYPPASSLFTSTDAFIKENVNEFVKMMATSLEPNVVGGGVIERLLIVAGGFNRALGRRNLGKLARDLESIQGVTEGIDGGIHEHLAKGGLFTPAKPLVESYYLSSWTYEMKFSILEDYLMMGFELDLYSEFEYPSVFWYMDHIFEMHIGHLNRMKTVMNRTNPSILELLWQFQQQADLGNTSGGGAAAKKSPKGSKKGGSQSSMKPLSLDSFVTKALSTVNTRDLREALLVCKQLIGRGNMLFSFALQKDGFLTHPPFDFYSHELSYNQRFKLFLSKNNNNNAYNMASPVPQSFQDFKYAEAQFLELTSLDLIQRSFLFFEEAKQVLEFLGVFLGRVEAQAVTLKAQQMEITQLVTACTRNITSLSKINSAAAAAAAAAAGPTSKKSPIVLTRETWKEAGFVPASGKVKHAKCFLWDLNPWICVFNIE